VHFLRTEGSLAFRESHCNKSIPGLTILYPETISIRTRTYVLTWHFAFVPGLPAANVRTARMGHSVNTLTCGVVVGGCAEPLARRAYDVLKARAPRGLDISWQAGVGQRGHCDLLILPVQADTFDLAKAEIAHLRRVAPACSIIVLCTDLPAEQTLELLRAGAFDFVSAAYMDVELDPRVQRAAGLLAHTQMGDTAAIEMARGHDLIGSSAPFVKQLAKLPVVAGSDASVLLLGETGTGKEVFARTIHYLSPRASRPLVAVNCGAIPTELMESELFGCVRGAYTSAHAARHGLVQEAEGGTLFLDEIDSLPLGAQAKLLRFLHDKEYRPVGASHACHADVRVIAASNQNLAALVERGGFRRDLYFRLNVLNILLPALRERRDDVPELARHSARLCCRRQQRAMIELTTPALRKLLEYDWPGNVRELHNVIECAVLFCRGCLIDADDVQLPGEPVAEEGVESFRDAKARMVECFERSYIERMLAVNAGNVTRAASAAHKNRRAFFALMRKHDIASEQFRPALTRS